MKPITCADALCAWLCGSGELRFGMDGKTNTTTGGFLRGRRGIRCPRGMTSPAFVLASDDAPWRPSSFGSPWELAEFSG